MDGGGMDSGLSSMGGLEPGGMSSITEVIQASLPGGEMSVQGGGMSSPYSMRGISAEEGPGMFSAGAPMATPSMSMGGYEGEGDLGPDIRRGTVPPHSNAHGFMSGGDLTGSMGPGGVSMGADYGIPSTTRTDPTAAAANWFGERFSAPASSTNAFNAPGFQGEVEEGVTIPQLATQTISTDPLARIRALRASQGQETHWPEWLSNLFARSTTGGAGRGPRVRR
jgi:hypothetical protein